MMYIVNIFLNEATAKAPNADELFAQHAAWFKKHFDAGNFLIVGPYQDKEKAGVIVAQAATRAELDSILAQDVYYPDMARYEVNAFAAKMVAENIASFVQ